MRAPELQVVKVLDMAVGSARKALPTEFNEVWFPQMSPSSRTASRSSESSLAEASILAREKSSISRP